MEITTNYQNGNAIVAMAGGLDIATSQQAMQDIEEQLKAFGPINELVCDASKLEYISSSGLRILLMLAKSYPNFRIIEVSPDIYQVLEMTGFAQIMKVEKALRTINIDGCDVMGIGGVGTVYRIDEDTIIKVFREGTTLSEVQSEINQSKASFLLGMPTAISFDVVRVGSQYGLVYELLDADTLSTCVLQHPERFDDYARQYAGVFRKLHAIEVPENMNIPSAMDRVHWAIDRISQYFDTQSIDLMLRIMDSIPPAHRLLHCDLQIKNTMMQGDELMMIDMGEVGYGHPLLDLGHAYSAMVTFVGEDYDKVIGLPREMGIRFYERALEYYFEGLDAAEFAHRKEQIATVSTVRGVSWLSLSDSFPAFVIQNSKEQFVERVVKQKDKLLAICETFKDWKV